MPPRKRPEFARWLSMQKEFSPAGGHTETPVWREEAGEPFFRDSGPCIGQQDRRRAALPGPRSIV